MGDSLDLYSSWNKKKKKNHMVLFWLEKYTNTSAAAAGENKIIMAYHKLLMFTY